GPITLPQDPGTVTIDGAGAVMVDGKQVAKLRVETVPPGTEMAHEGGTFLVPDASRTPLADSARSVRQGYLEESNVNPLTSMVDMIDIQRSYVAVQRTMVTL